MPYAYYNEFDPKAAAWLRELIKQGHIADGEVDTRSIEDVTADDLTKFTQCHFFAGIGVWSYALRRAGWPDDRPVWTGSCPCQPFSAAGKAGGFDDERHLWPAFFHLVQQCRPATIFGEQVASKDGLAWLDLVHTDLEGTGYSVGALDLCAAGFGAPHIRQRIFFVANSCDEGSSLARREPQLESAQQQFGYGVGEKSGTVADRDGARLGPGQTSEASYGRGSPRVELAGFCDAGALDYPADTRHDHARQHERRSPLLAARPVESVVAGCLADTSSGTRERNAGSVLGTQAQVGGENRPVDGDNAVGFEHGGANGVAQGDTEPTRLEGHGWDVGNGNQPGRHGAHAAGSATTSSAVDDVAHPLHAGRPERWPESGSGSAAGGDGVGELADSQRLGHTGLQRGRSEGLGRGDDNERAQPRPESRGPVNGFWHPADWIPCRDGKWRPVEPKYVAVVDGPAAGMVPGGDCGDAAKTESEEINATQINGTGGTEVRTVQQDELQTARPPQGRELGEQRAVELADFVRFLPSSFALAELHGDTATTEALRDLLETSGAQRLVQHPLEPVEAVWRSLGQEIQDRFRVALGQGRFVRVVEFPLAHGAPARVGRLRGYGNAIVGPVAQAFIEAYLDI